jgi:heme/copper-type cytochrome/quinol oxidase subunit 2
MNERPQSSIPTRWIMAWTIVLWALGTSVYAYIYVTSRVRLPDAVGYEADWSWQLFFFSFVRLPIFIPVLGALLYVEYLLRSRVEPPHRTA